MSISIGGANLQPQQLAAPQQKPAAAPVDVARDETARPSSPPPGTGQVVDKTA